MKLVFSSTVFLLSEFFLSELWLFEVFSFVLFFIVKFMPFVSSDLILNFEINYFVYVSMFLQIILPPAIFILEKTKKRNYYEKVNKISA